jgi:hypothetical protein
MTAPRRYFPIHPAVDFAQSGTREPDVVRRLEFVVPPPGFTQAWLRLYGVKLSPEVAFSGDVYLTPPDVKFNPQDYDFRETYFANLISMLRGSGPSGANWGDRAPPTTSLVVDLTLQLSSLAQEHAGEAWLIILALVAITGDEEQTPANASLADLIDIDTMELEVR